jgi:hypothetical protein
MSPVTVRIMRNAPVLAAATFLLLFLLAAVAVVGVASDEAGATPTAIDLGTAGATSVLAGAGISNTLASVLPLDGDTWPTPTITGFPPGVTLGTLHGGDGVAEAAQTDMTTAYNAAAAETSTNSVTGLDLGGMNLAAGVYTASTAMSLTGTVPLTLSGDPASVFIFQAGSTLTTGSKSSVVLSGGVQACNVFWQVGTTATIGTSTAFVGNILAFTSINLLTSATVDGRALASSGFVSLEDNVFTNSACVPTTTTTVAPTSATTVAPNTATTVGVKTPTAKDPKAAGTPIGTTPGPDLVGAGANGLAFTGFDAEGLTLVAAVMIGFGATCLLVRRRWRLRDRRSG